MINDVVDDDDGVFDGVIAYDDDDYDDNDKITSTLTEKKSSRNTQQGSPQNPSDDKFS